MTDVPLRHVRPVIDDGQLVGYDEQRAGIPNHGHGVPALTLITPCKFTNSQAVAVETATLEKSVARCKIQTVELHVQFQKVAVR
jgi:hypothetical protein